MGEQFILTTHNPLILDWIPVESIVLLHRDTQTGQISKQRFSDSITVQNNLDFMNPGEIWINFNKKELLQKNTK